MTQKESVSKFIFEIALPLIVVAMFTVGIPAAGFLILDYVVRAEQTVKAINNQCGTKYENLDYLRIGPRMMLLTCYQLTNESKAQ